MSGGAYRLVVADEAGDPLAVAWLPRDPGPVTTTVDFVPSDIGETVAEGRLLRPLEED